LLTGCIVQVPATVQTATPSYSTSWVEQVKLQIEKPAMGARVAAASPSSWHRIRLQVGRLDGTMPVMSKTVDPTDTEAMRRAFGNLSPGDGYFIQVGLIHLDAGGAEWEIGRGQLGGNGQSVRLNPGPNAVPIPIKPMVAGGYIDAVPTSLRRASTRTSSTIGASSIIVVDNGPSYQPIVDTYEPALPDYDDYNPSLVERDHDWDAPDESDDSESDESEEQDIEDTGDWTDLTSAYEILP
jgi:hypothetical protein